jgi:tetratricopeptide (TPR) repeat protein
VNQTRPPVVPSAAEIERVLAEVDRAVEQDLDRAIQLSAQALNAGFEHPKLLNLVAFQLEEDGRYDDAMRLLDRAIGLDPKDVLVWNSVGLCLVKQDRRKEAVAAFEHALALNPLFPQAYRNLGAALEQLGDFDGAREQYERAIRVAPDYADAVAGLASLGVRNGDWPAVRTFAAQAIALEEAHPAATAAIASAELNDKKYGAAEQILRELMISTALDRFARPTVQCLLGDALDGQDRPDEAFAEYVAGKAGFRALHHDTYERPGKETQLDFAHRLGAYFDATAAEPWSRPSKLSDGEAPVERVHAFLVGFPRSGTTLLENVLASHEAVLAIDERVTLRDIEELYFPDTESLDRLASVSAQEASVQRAAYWDRIRSFGLSPEGKVVVDKMPLYTVRLPIITKLFPGVKILFALRDPRDVVLSCFRRPFQINAGMYQFCTLEGAARYYDAVMRLAETYRKVLPLDVHVVRYESYVENFESETRAICDFLALDWNDSLRDFAANARKRQIRTPSAAQVREGLYTSGAGQWRRYAKHLEPVMPILAPWIEKFGYEPT